MTKRRFGAHTATRSGTVDKLTDDDIRLLGLCFEEKVRILLDLNALSHEALAEKFETTTNVVRKRWERYLSDRREGLLDEAGPAPAERGGRRATKAGAGPLHHLPIVTKIPQL